MCREGWSMIRSIRAFIVSLFVITLLMVIVQALTLGTLEEGTAVDAERTRHSGDLIDAPFGGNPVTIDGIISGTEWTDASRVTVDIYGDDMTIYAKQDGSNLFFAYTFIDYIIPEIYIDALDDGGTAPQIDDRRLHLSAVAAEYAGDGSQWVSVPVSGWIVNEEMMMDIYEFQISLAKFGIVPGEPRTMGICFFANTKFGNYLWPTAGDYVLPDTWGNISSSDLWDIPNSAPVLSNGGISQEEGFPDTDFTYSVRYTDDDNDPPSSAKVIIDGIEHDMSTLDNNYADGSMFQYRTTLGLGDHNYYFSFNDGKVDAMYPTLGVALGPSVISRNTPPTLVGGGIPSGLFEFEEDSGGGNDLIDLEHYFTDDRDDGHLTFEIVHQEDETLLKATLTGSIVDFEQMIDDWHGTLSFRVEALDGGIEGYPLSEYQMGTESNDFTVSVTPVNDGPMIVSLGDADVSGQVYLELYGNDAAVEDRPFSIEVKVDDVDLTTDPSERLTFTAGPDRFVIEPFMDDPSRALLTFLPGNDDVGVVEFNVTVEDDAGCKDAIVVSLEVQNTNDDPLIVKVVRGGIDIPISDKRVELTGASAIYEDTWFNVTVMARDDDLDIGILDPLYFTMDPHVPGIEIDPSTGELTFNPSQEDVGSYVFSVQVKDSSGTGIDDQIEFELEVSNVNDPPLPPTVHTEDGDFDFVQGDGGFLLAEGYDIDLDYDPSENLTFYWFSDVDGPLGTGGYLPVSLLSLGVHNITLEAHDRYGLVSYSTVRLIVSAPVVPQDENDLSWLLIYIIPLFLFITIMVLAGMAFLVYARLKTKALLDNVNRKMIFELVRDYPGIHFMALSKRLGIMQGVLSHHLNILEKNHLVKSLQDGMYRRFYLYDQSIEFKLVLTEVQQSILFIIKQNPGISQSKISNVMGKNKMVVNYHIKMLKDIGLLTYEREGRETHCYLTLNALTFFDEKAQATRAV